MKDFLKFVWNILCEVFYSIYLLFKGNKTEPVHDTPQSTNLVPTAYHCTDVAMPVDLYGLQLLRTGKNKYNALRNKHWAKA